MPTEISGSTGVNKIQDGTIAQADFASGVGGLYSSIAIIVDSKSADTAGGTFTTGAWRTRDLNTEISDADGIVSIASNQFTLQAGTYTIKWSSSGYRVGRHSSKLRDITAGADVGIATAEYAPSNDDTSTRSFGSSVITISSANVYEIQAQCQSTYNTYGFGVGGGSYTGSTVEYYALVEILKHT